MTNAEFEIFKDNMKHSVNNNQLLFLKHALCNQTVERFVEDNNLLCALYTLAMIDYVSRINDVPLYNKYNFLRSKRYDHPIYPMSVKIYAMISDKTEKEIFSNYIKQEKLTPVPEFLRHNIIEGDILNGGSRSQM